MIRNTRVLDEDYVPGDIVRRNQELNEVGRSLEPIRKGKIAENVFLFGPTGTGKTAITRYILNDLEESIAEVNTKYINCWDNYTRYRVLHEVLDGFTSTTGIHRQSTATDELLHRVRQYDGPPYVVVLDEVDQLQDMDVLYNLYRVRNLSMIFISNEEEDLFWQFDNRLQSRLHASRTINLSRYSLAALTDILKVRAKHALVENAIKRENLKMIADKAAGDARVAIGILKMAAQEAEVEGEERITAELINSVVQDARHLIHQRDMDQLKDDQRLILDILREHGELQPSELYEFYQAEAEEPKTNRTVRNHLSKLQHYNLITAEGEKRARTYRIRKVR